MNINPAPNGNDIYPGATSGVAQDTPAAQAANQTAPKQESMPDPLDVAQPTPQPAGAPQQPGPPPSHEPSPQNPASPQTFDTSKAYPVPLTAEQRTDERTRRSLRFNRFGTKSLIMGFMGVALAMLIVAQVISVYVNSKALSDNSSGDREYFTRIVAELFSAGTSPFIQDNSSNSDLSSDEIKSGEKNRAMLQMAASSIVILLSLVALVYRGASKFLPYILGYFSLLVIWNIFKMFSALSDLQKIGYEANVFETLSLILIVTLLPLMYVSLITGYITLRSNPS